MNNSTINDYLLQCRLRTARHKRQMQHADFEKQLRALDREERQLRNQQYALGWVELQTPVMRGYKRYFVLRDDQLRTPKKAFFEALLVKINTTDYSSRKDFKVKKRKFGRKIYVVKPQELLTPDRHDLVKKKFTEWELELFENGWCTAGGTRNRKKYLCLPNRGVLCCAFSPTLLRTQGCGM